MSLPSLDLLYELTLAEHVRQREHFDGLDSKAGLVLGFAGTLIALAPDVGAVGRAAAVWLAASAAVCAAAAFWPRKLPALAVVALREYLQAEPEFTKLTVHDTFQEIIGQGANVVGQKARLVKAGMGFLALGGATLAVAIALGGTA
jgi:hypothetical protein